MPENNSSSAIAVVLLLGWIAFAFVYPYSWQPHSLALWPQLKAGERAYVLKLPDGPLAHILATSSIVTLKIDSAQADVKPAYQSGATVLGTQCFVREDRGSDCYAVVAVPSGWMTLLDSARSVSVWLERQ
jgi:hypothetical protein